MEIMFGYFYLCLYYTNKIVCKQSANVQKHFSRSRYRDKLAGTSGAWHMHTRGLEAGHDIYHNQYRNQAKHLVTQMSDFYTFQREIARYNGAMWYGIPNPENIAALAIRQCIQLFIWVQNGEKQTPNDLMGKILKIILFKYICEYFN